MKLKKRAKPEDVLKHRRAVRLAVGVYRVWSRERNRPYKVMVYDNEAFKAVTNLMVCECEASVDRDMLEMGLHSLNLDAVCVHKAVVARRLLSHPDELKAIITRVKP
jgi:hypothetical protein